MTRLLYSISISYTRPDYAQLFMVSRLVHRWCRCVPDREPPPDPRLPSLGMQIRRHREEHGYSLEELAERSGLSSRGLIYIEHGKRNPSVLTSWTLLPRSISHLVSSSTT